MAQADAVAIPTALWAALALKFDSARSRPRSHLRLLPGRGRFGAVLLLGVRPVPRGDPLHGAQGDADRVRRRQPVGVGVGGVRPLWSPATRFRCRRSASTGRWRCCTSAAAASWRATCSCAARGNGRPRDARGDLRRRQCRGARVLGPARRPGFRAGGLHRRQEIAAGQQHQRRAGVRLRGAAGAGAAAPHRPRPARDARRPRGAGGARS